MKWRVLEILRCPTCGEGLKATAELLGRVLDPERTVCTYECSICHRPAGKDCAQCFTEEIVKGQLRCACGRVYTIEHAIPHFYGEPCTDAKAEFSFYQEQLGGVEKREPTCFWKLLLPPGSPADFFRGKLVLDIGCGDALFDRTLDELGHAEIIALDIDPVICTLAERFRANLHFLRASAEALPVAKGRFGFVFSVYALHYLRNMYASLEAAGERVAPDGWLTLSLYPRRSRFKECLSRTLRAVLTPLPYRVRRFILFGMAPFVSLAGALSGVSLRHDGWSRCVDLLEAYFGPPYMHVVSSAELTDWFDRHGFAELAFGPHPVTVCGKRPE